MSLQSDKQKHIKYLSIFAIIAIGIKLLWSYIQGFRWPSDYVLTNHVITYIYGFVPRSLIGEIGYLAVGDNWYSWKYMSIVIIAAGLTFCCWTFYLLIKSGYQFKDILTFTLVLILAFSPYSKYYLHEMGYYEQYGFVLLIVLFALKFKNRIAGVYVFPAIVSFLALMISESNAFLIMPAVFAISFLRIWNENSEQQAKFKLKNTVILILTYIPHIIYILIIWFCKVPESLVVKLQNHDRDMVNSFDYYNFAFREDVHLFMSGDRSNAAIWGRTLRPIHAWCVATVLLVIVLVAMAIYLQEKNNTLLITYLMSSIGVALIAYSIVIVAWDLERFFFCMFISVFFVSIYTAKKYIKKTISTKYFIPVLIFVLIFMLGISEYRLVLFDRAVYNENISDFISVLKQRL